MDEVTKQAFNEFVQAMMTATTSGMNWTADQAPLVVQEWLQYTQILSGFCVILGLLTLILLWTKVRAWANKMWNEEDYDTNSIGWVVLITFTLITTLATGLFLQTFLKVTFAPRIAVLEKFLSMMP